MFETFIGDNRDKAIFIGLFLSKFDREALDCFGFTTFEEAYNIFGLAIKIKPASIKNYRDEFDPLFPNSRKGRYSRSIRDYCKRIFDIAKGLSLIEMSLLINDFLIDNNVDTSDLSPIEDFVGSSPFSKRVFTGKAAEEYFVDNYQTIDFFKDCELTDLTNYGCGFDFRLTSEFGNYYIEVKGISERNGSIMMTEKEFIMSQRLTDKYCLFIVKNFVETPVHQYFFNPSQNKILSFQKKVDVIKRTSYITVIG